MDLDEQLAANREIWALVVELGTGEGGPLVADVFFDAPDQARALAVVDALIARGDHAEAVLVRPGVLGLRRRWSVTGQRRIAAPSLGALDDLVREMAALAAAQGVVFDGWGAEAV